MDSELYQEHENTVLYEQKLENEFIEPSNNKLIDSRIMDSQTPVKAQQTDRGILKLSSWNNRIY